MTGKNDDRPVPRRRTPQPAPDANTDPMDPPATAVSAPITSTPEPAKPAAAKPSKASAPRRAVPASVPITPKDPEDRAVVQLGIRVSVQVDRHLEEVRLATGRTRRELVESAIMALRVP